MKTVYERETKYYKYVYSTWTQPTLASNGSFGGNSMAVALAYGGNNGSYGTAYKLFSPNTDLAGFYCDEWQSWMEVRIYFPKPVSVRTITFNTPDGRTDESGAMVGTVLYAGNYAGSHEKTMLSIGKIYGTYTNNNVPDNGYYQYYTLYFKNEGTAWNDRVEIRYINITGVARDTVAGTASDYDYKIEGGKTYVIKENDTYKAFNI